MSALLRLAAAFPNPEIHPATIRVYADALKDQDPAHIEWACSEAIRTSKHFPRVAELVDLIRKRKIALRDAEERESRARQLTAPVNPNPPKLSELFEKQKAEKAKEVKP